jgi:hypothetical protein
VSDLVGTRVALQRVATHVLARRRFAVSGRFGLRGTPGGFGTPAFGDDVEVLRIAGTTLVRERAGDTASCAINGPSLAELAAFAGADLATPFDAGHDTPALGDPGEPIALDASACAVVADWFDVGWRALDTVAAGLGTGAGASVIQLWPEHFDAGCAVAVGPGEGDRCNLGASPGDASSDEPYLYIGPWSTARPGHASFWNAPFGAVLTRTDLGEGDRVAAAVAFFRRGIDLQREALAGT